MAERTKFAGAIMFLVLFMFDTGLLQADEPMEPELAEILVTATRTEKSILNVPASVRIIERREVILADPITVDELFKTVVGVDLQGSGVPGSRVKLNMRGLTSGYGCKRVLVLVDGRRITDQYQGNVEFALVPADGIERIEIVRGPASALYGSGAMGGVINIITRKRTETPVTELKASAGSHNTRHYSFIHGRKAGGCDYFITGSYIGTDGYTKNSDGTDRDWQANNFTGNLGWQFSDRSQLRFYFGNYCGGGTDENSDRETQKDYEAVLYTLRWSKKKDAKLQVRLYRNAEHHDYDWKYPGKGIYRQDTLGGEVQQSMWISERHLATFGLDGRNETVDINEVLGKIDADASTTACYVQDEIFLADTFQITVGIRNDYNVDYGDAISPRVGILWRALPDGAVFASVNRAHRAPGLSDRFVKAEYNGMIFEGNLDLDPETLTAYEAGVRRKLDDKLRVEFVVFHNDMNDSFDFLLDPDGVFRIRNVNRMSSYGIESRLRYQVTRDLSALLNYSFIDGEYEDFPSSPDVEGNQLAYLAKDKAAFQLNYDNARGFSHMLTCRYVGSRYGDAQNASENKMDDYVTVDWRSRAPLTEYARLTLNIDHLFDETYQEFSNVDQPGRTFRAGLELTF